MDVMAVIGGIAAIVGSVLLLTVAAFCVSYAIAYGWHSGKAGARRNG